MSTLTLDQFRSAWASGGFRSVGVTAAGGRFFVTGQPRIGDRITLATTRGKALRVFRNADTAIAVLHAIGVRTMEVDTAQWDPDLAAQDGPRRQDTSDRQRRAHQAAAHDAWFRSEVEQSLREADDPNAEWVSNEDVERQSEDLWASLPMGGEAGRAPR